MSKRAEVPDWEAAASVLQTRNEWRPSNQAAIRRWLADRLSSDPLMAALEGQFALSLLALPPEAQITLHRGSGSPKKERLWKYGVLMWIYESPESIMDQQPPVREVSFFSRSDRTRSTTVHSGFLREGEIPISAHTFQLPGKRVYFLSRVTVHDFQFSDEHEPLLSFRLALWDEQIRLAIQHGRHGQWHYQTEELERERKLELIAESDRVSVLATDQFREASGFRFMVPANRLPIDLPPGIRI